MVRNTTIWYKGNKVAGVKDWEAKEWQNRHIMCHVCVIHFCPTCGDIHSRITIHTDAPKSETLWAAHARKCASHGNDPLLSYHQKAQPAMLLDRYPIELLIHENLVEQRS